MSKLLIRNGTVVTLGAQGRVMEHASLLIDDGIIVYVGPASDPAFAEEGVDRIVDASGKLVMPGMICGHHHFYSTMARGMTPPGEPAANFGQILERLWWKVDRALEPEDVSLSALIPLLSCIRNGTTTIIDHHASPSCRQGSLDLIAEAVRQAGLRACLCYEVSDRNVAGGGVEENERFIQRCRREQAKDLVPLMGLHASFTVSDETLKRCRDIGERYGVGYHVHVAEAASDVEATMERYGKRPIERFEAQGLTGGGSIFVHCVHVDDREIEILAKTGTWVVHNPESNMNNAVGAAPILKMLSKGVSVGLGTDGMSSDMFAQLRAAYLLWHHDAQDPRVGFMEAPAIALQGNSMLAKRLFGITLGSLEAGGAGDVIVLDYKPPTPLTDNNFLGHLIFGLVDATVDTTICQGKVVMENRKILVLDEEALAARTTARTRLFWERVKAL